MVGIGFGIDGTDPRYSALKDRFLDLYERHLCVDTRLFEGMAELLDTLETRGLLWGIVTNKAARFTQPLVQRLGLIERAACVVSGDTTSRAKPHPDPLLHAAAAIQLAPIRCLYVGDDLRDIQAARAAGMRSIAVRFGYLGTAEPPEAWGADAVVTDPHEILDHL